MTGRRMSKSMLNVVAHRKLLDRGLDAIEDNNLNEILNVADEIVKMKFHNPFWVSLVAMAVGRVLMRSAFTPLRRLGWSMVGYGGATGVHDAARYGLELAERIKNLRASGITPPPAHEYEKTGGIGLQ